MTTSRSLFIITLITAVLFGGFAPSAHAQAPAVQKAFEEVRTKLDDLVSAKDENLADDLALRIQAFKKVVEFSVEEANTLKIKLLATELRGVDEEALGVWKELMTQELLDANAYYEATLVTLTTTTVPLDLEGVKTLATSFKEWRDGSFAPLVGELEEFLLVAGQARALEVAEARFVKIQSDVEKLERARIKGTETLVELLAAARAYLDDAAESHERARTLFTAVIAPPPADEEEETPSEAATSTDPVEVAEMPTIRDEVRTSLESIKQAYLSFIEMSVEVKKILR